jgi:hypothetical protein
MHVPSAYFRLKETLDKVSYPGLSFQLVSEDNTYQLRVQCLGTCNVTGEPMQWFGRWWRLSPHMIPTEIVLTAFKAVLTALEHEAREQFTYKGVAVLDSHIDVEELVRIRSEEKLDARPGTDPNHPHTPLREKNSY